MYCPRCGSEIRNNALRCDVCGVKVNMICPSCNSLNPFGIENCLSCGAALLKYCRNCNSANMATAEFCRKCAASFVIEKQPQIAPVEQKMIEPTVQEVIGEKAVEPVVDVQKIIEPEVVEEQVPPIQPAAQEIEPEIEVAPVEIEEASEDIAIEETLINQPVEQTVDVPEPIVEPTEEDKIQDDISKEVDKIVNDPSKVQESQPEPQNTDSQAQDEKIEIVYYSQIQAMQKIVNTAKNSKEKFIIAVNGDEGSGKSIVLQYVMKELQENNIVSVFGECSPYTQISNFGFLQDAFLRLFSLPAFIVNPEVFVKNNKKVFENIFNLLNGEEINQFINFLYPSKVGEFDSIVQNKEKTFSLLEKVIKSILAKNPVVFVADDFDIIDGASYDFFVYLIEKGYFENGLKLIVAYKERRVAQSFFYSNNIRESAFENIYLDKLPKDQMETFVGNFINNDINVLPIDVTSSIYRNSNGNASYIEQCMALLHDKKCLYLDNDKIKFQSSCDAKDVVPPNIALVIKERLRELSPVTRNVIYTASLLGYKFDIQILTGALNLPMEQVGEILGQLQDSLYVTQINQYMYSFKGLSLWHYIYDEAKSSELFNENCKKVFQILNTCVLSNNSLKAIVAQSVLAPKDLFDIWMANSELTAYVGDINLYVISQKQCLKLLSDNNFENSQILYNRICEKIGKLLYKTTPTEAITYLSNVISNSKTLNDSTRIVDLCGYLVHSCYLTCNYHGVVEAVDLTIDMATAAADELEIALIKSRKIKALSMIGNCEEVINIAQNDIIPVLEEALQKAKNQKNVSMTLVYESWLETNLLTANAYSLQGSEKAIEVIDNVLEIMQVNKLESKHYETKAALSKALALSVIGRVKDSASILEDVTRAYVDDVMNNEFVSQWNMINVLNKMLANNYNDLKQELFTLATFANNTNDSFSKNIIKTILGYLIHRDGNYSKAMEIYNEQVTYFAKEKIAIGALLCWYLIAQISLTVDGADKALDIASKALEVAQNPKINNYNSMVYLQKFIAEVFIIKGDLDATKMYLEKALLIAKQFGLKYAQVELYLAFAKYLEELLSVRIVNKSENAKNALNMYEYALSIAIDLDLENLIAKVNKSKSSFKTYCQLNAIDIS